MEPGEKPGQTFSTIDARPHMRDLGPPPTVPGYEVLDVLGAGGIGTVYRARQRSLDRLVALKVLPPGALSAPALARFRREARTAAQVDDPHVCIIYELGESDGRPYIAMELVRGIPLHHLRGAQPPIERVNRIVRQVAQALAAAHALGVVHRDIKPENIMLRDDDRVKVVDFGLARVQGDEPRGWRLTEAITEAGMLLGTVPYMSPEQLRGETAGPASDVFSLGLVWYELATGVHPFQSSSLAAALNATQYMSVPAEPLARAQMSPRHAALLRQMLAKDATERPSSAAVVAILSGEGDAQTAASSAPARRAVTVGRDRELQVLRSAWTEAAAGRGCGVAISGDAGIGKTTLVEELVADVHAGGTSLFVARGNCSERVAGAAAYAPVLDALRGIVRGYQGGLIAELMSRHAPSWYASCATAAGVEIRTDTPPEVRKRELGDLLEAAGRIGPMIWFFDDVQWADDSTLDLLVYVAERARDLPVLIVTTSRPGVHAFAKVLPGLVARRGFRDVPLTPVTEADVDRYIGLVCPDHPERAELRALVFQRTAGHPFFMVELLRFLRDRPLREAAQQVPDSIRGMVESQLQQLSPDEHELLSAAAVQGFEHDAAIVARAMNADAVAVEDRLAAIARTHRLIQLVREHELPDGTLTVRFAFSHVLFQNALYNALLPARRTALALAVADAIQASCAGQVMRSAPELAILYETARRFDRSVELYRLAAEGAIRVGANPAAAQLVDRALALLPRLPAGRERQQIELSLLTLSSMALRASRGFSSPELEALHRRLYDVATALGDVRTVGATLWGMVLYHSVGGDYGKARTEVEQLAALLAEHPHPALRFQPLLLGGIISLFVGDIGAAVTGLAEAQAACIPIAADEYVELRIESDPRTLCDTFVAWAKCLSGEGAAGLALAEDVLARQDNSLGRIHALQALTNVTGLAGEPKRAKEIATECVRLCDRVGAPFYGAIARGTLGSALVTLGAPAEGLATLEQGLATLRAIGARNMEPYLLVEIAEAHRSLGDLGAASARVDEARATIAKTGEHLYGPEVLRIEGRVRAARGDAPDEVDACFRRAAEVARAGGSRLYEQRAQAELSRRV